MKVKTYTAATRERVISFLKDKRSCIKSELVSLGGDRAVNWGSLELVLEDLVSEGLVRKSLLGRRVIIFEWVGS